MEVVHIASQSVQVGSVVRQRCVWCGEELLDVDLATIATAQTDERAYDRRYPTWLIGSLVAKDGGAAWQVDHVDGADLPEASCVAPSCTHGLEDTG